MTDDLRSDAAERRDAPRGRSPLPPGETTTVSASSALVLAPHYDDETLGCGGLVARLAADGCRVRVLFLTDGGAMAPSAQGEGVAPTKQERQAYGARRLKEAGRALEELGVDWADRLGLPDGELEGNLTHLVRDLGKALVSQRPDLLLVPSPLEVTADHRAAFAAVHRLLAPVRPDDHGQQGEHGELARVARGLQVLCYEVNHPGYPDVLVDVTDQVPQIEAAMACYGSQQERHDYLAASLGLRRFRTLSLPSGDVVHAEGYRRLRLDDFVTRSPAQLVHHLGGVPELLAVADGPPVSVVVRTKDRPELLATALDSLAAGTYKNVQVVVVNDGGATPELPEGFPLGSLDMELVELSPGRGRAGAANAGLAAARGEWIAFLDDDDVVAPEHLAVLVAAAQGEGVRAVYSDAAVTSLELAGDGGTGWREVSRRLPYSRDFDADLLALDNYIPFNTVLLEHSLVDELGEAPFDTSLDIFEDWDFLLRLARRAPFHHLRRVTAEYRHYRGTGHHALGEKARDRPDFLATKTRVLEKHRELLDPARLAGAVDALRTEAVRRGEQVSSLERDARRQRAEIARRAEEYGALERRYHAEHGELESLRGEVARLGQELKSQGGEIQRLYDQERELRAVVDDQSEHLGRTYGEISRLNGLLEQLRGMSLKGILGWWRRARASARPAGPGGAGDP